MTYTPVKDPVFELDPDIELDYYHPGNHDFMIDLEHMKKAIVSQALTMKEWHHQAVRRRMAGVSNLDIAEEFGVTPAAVSNVLNGEKALRLRQLLIHHQTALEGPSTALRKRMVWEIAVDNQKVEPKTTLSAIQELNRMEGVYDDHKKQTASSNTIIINNNLFPKGKLDGG